MSTPTPPGRPGEGQPGAGQPGSSGPPPGPQPAAQNQQPTQWTGYDPNRYQQQDRPQDETRVFDPNGSGGFSGPPGYQRPPQKNRAGLFIVLMVVMLIAVLGIGGVVAYNLVSDKSSETSQPGGLDPSDIPTEIPSDYPSYLPSEDPSEQPSIPTPTSLPSSGGADLAGATALAKRFVAQLNANKPTAAAAMACKESEDLLPTLIKVLIKPPTKLTVGETLGKFVIIVRVSGSTNGHSVEGIVLVQEGQGASPCIRAIQVAPK